MKNTVQTEPPSEILQDENCGIVMDYNPDNKRSSYRIKINSPVTLKTKSFTEIPSQAQNVQTINLSEGGIGISFDAEVKLPSPLLIEFGLMNTPLQFQGEVRWNKIFDDGKYYCGVHFLDKDEHQDSILKRFLFTDDEYILNLVKDLKTEDREASDKIESFFRRDVKWFIEDLIDLEQHIKNKSMSEESIQERLNIINDEIVKKGDALEEKVKKGVLIKKIKDAFRFLTGHWVLKSKMMEMAFKKPRGYPGDYKLIEIIYNNQPISENLGFYYDRYFHNYPYTIAVRRRKDMMAELLKNTILEADSSQIDILNLASGPCREMSELFSNPEITGLKKKINFTCVDFDKEALEFSKNRLRPPKNTRLEFLNEDIVNLIKNEKWRENLSKQHLIYSIGLADYLPDRILKKLIYTAFSLLKIGGRLIVAHKDRDKFKPLVPDWFTDWVFYPRNVKSVIKLVEDSVAGNYSLDIDWEDTKKIFFLTITKG
ncbi:MAG: PilZ domain-containing protein [Nitrospirota bacterium]